MADAPAIDFSAINPDCFGKVGFASKGAAQVNVQHQKRRRLTNGSKSLAPYHCEACGQWHIRGQRL